MTVKQKLESIKVDVDALKTEIKNLESCCDIDDYRADYVSDMLRRIAYLEELL